MNHIASKPYATALELANAVGITERAARKIIADLVADGYITKEREGRRNQYRLNPDLPLRHPSHQETAIGELLQLLTSRTAKSVETPAAETNK